MNWKSYIPIAAACVLGLVAAKIGWNYMAQRQVTVVAPAPADTVRVVVVTKDIPSGTYLRDVDLALKEIPTGVAAGQTYSSVFDLVNRVPAVPLVKGQAVVETMLMTRGAPTGLPSVIPDGMRALTIDVNDTTGVGGMIQPGCHVDLVMTLGADANGPAMARTVADNVEILAIGHVLGHKTAEPPPPDGQQPDVGNARNVTLLVTPQEAHMVELAVKMGNPRFVLRGAQDTKPTPNSGVTLADLRLQSPEQNAQGNQLANLHTPAAGPTTHPVGDFWNVRVIRAGAESTVNLPMNPQDTLEQPVTPKPSKVSSAGVQNELAPAISH
jgi:pilus assembly protein CpaB